MFITATIIVKGTRYYRAKLEFEKGELHEGAELRLVHEPNNPYDSNAVSVRLRKTGAKLGHVPRELAPKYFSLVNAGRIKNTTISKVSKNGDYVHLEIQITYDQSEEELLARQNTVFWRSAFSLPEEPGVYAIENLQTGRLYIGSSINVRNRARHHLKDLFLNTHQNSLLQYDFFQLGPDRFKIFVLSREIDQTRLQVVENEKIQELLANRKHLYNLTSDGQGRPHYRPYRTATESISDRMEKKIAEEEHRKRTDLFHTKRQNIYEEYENRLKEVLPQKSFWVYFAGAFVLVLVIFLIIAPKMRYEVLLFLAVITSFIITPFIKNYYTAKARQSKQYREILQQRDLKIEAIKQEHLSQ